LQEGNRVEHLGEQVCVARASANREEVYRDTCGEPDGVLNIEIRLGPGVVRDLRVSSVVDRLEREGRVWRDVGAEPDEKVL
jgi:hypothetical protein